MSQTELAGSHMTVVVRVVVIQLLNTEGLANLIVFLTVEKMIILRQKVKTVGRFQLAAD